MNKWLTFFLIFAFVVTISCKKEEEQKAPESSTAQTAPPKAQAKPEIKTPTQPVLPLELYKEKDLVVSIPPDQFKDTFTADVSIQDKKFKGMAVRDLLQKNKLKGAYVILSGPYHSVSLSWDKANSDGLYLVALKTGLLQLKTTTPNNFSVSDFPGRIVKITASASSTLPPVKKPPQTAKKP
jgi:hypothetical protein